jgi:hypothetical protein
MDHKFNYRASVRVTGRNLVLFMDESEMVMDEECSLLMKARVNINKKS